MDSEDPGQVSPVADPGLADQARRRLARQAGNPANGAAAAAGCGGLVVSTAGLTVAVVLHFVAGLSWWWVGGGVLAAAAVLMATGVIEVSSGVPDHRDRDRIVDPSDLDDPCRELLLRAQRAIAAVLGSEVYASDMLDHAAGEMVLRWHEWDIAAALREITRLRAELAASAAAGGAGPMAAAVLDSQQRAITLARDATEARVGALESYALQVQAADAAQQDWLSALRLSALNSQYLDLVARTAAGEHALAEITGLTEQAVTAAEVFRGSLHQAALAAEAWPFLPRPPPHENDHPRPRPGHLHPRPKPPAAALGSPTRPEPLSGRFGRGGILRGRPLVTGDSVAASIVPSRCPSVVRDGSRRGPGEGWRQDW